MTSELVLFSGDVDNTLNVYLLKVVRPVNWYSFQRCGQHTERVFIESCTTSELVLFSCDVDNTLHMYLLKKKYAHYNTTVYLHHGITICKTTCTCTLQANSKNNNIKIQI